MIAHKLSTEWTELTLDDRTYRVRVSALMVSYVKCLTRGHHIPAAWLDFEYSRGDLWRPVMNLNSSVKLTELYTSRAASKIFDFEWLESTEEAFDYALEVLPPLQWQRGAFLMSEPMSHDYDGRGL